MQRKAMLLAMTTYQVNVDFKKMLWRAWKWSEGPYSQDKTYKILKKKGPGSINKHTEMQQERYIYILPPILCENDREKWRKIELLLCQMSQRLSCDTDKLCAPSWVVDSSICLYSWFRQQTKKRLKTEWLTGLKEETLHINTKTGLWQEHKLC